MSSDESTTTAAPISALHSNIRDKGTNAYYYAHKKRSVSTDRPITAYAWSDGKKSATVYIDVPAIGTHPDDLITLDWSARSVDVRIREFDPSGADLVFKIKYLYEEVMAVTLKKKDDKLVLRLTKAKELTWYTLKKDHP